MKPTLLERIFSTPLAKSTRKLRSATFPALFIARRLARPAAVVLLVGTLAFGGMAGAETYNVGPGQTYTSLEELRAASVVLTAGDEVVLYGDDASLMENIDLTLTGGGAITIRSNDGTVRTITQDPNFTDNAHGGILNFADTSAVNLTLENLTFDDNHVSGDNFDLGGVIYARGALTLTGTNLAFTDNSVTGDGNNSGRGGAICANSTLDFADGDYTFTGNSAKGSSSGSGLGGAIYAYANLNILGGDYRFINNSAEQQGGAIWVYDNAKLIADGGDILFRGNTAAGAANAMYLNNFGNNDTLTLAANAGHSITFYDPIQSRLNSPNLTIAINSTDGTTTGKTTGTVSFDGTYWRDQGKTLADNADYFTSKVCGNTTVYGGTLELKNGASYGAANDIGSFTLKSGATLLSNSYANIANTSTVQASTITLENGSILAFDISKAAFGTSLKLDAGTSMSTVTVADSGGIKVDISAFHSSGGSVFNLAQISGGGSFELGAYTLTTRGENLAKTRAAGSALIEDDNKLQVETTSGTGIVTWTGNANDGKWNATSKNWDTSLIADKKTDGRFLHGDAVVFANASATPTTITIQDAGVQVAEHGTNPGMEIKSGNWIFTGGEIEGGNIHFTGNGSVTFGGVLNTGTRRMNQRVTVAENITAGLNANNALLIFADMGAGQTHGGAISGGSGSSLTLDGNFNFIDNSVTGSGNDSGNGGAIFAGSTLKFTDGSYAFTGNSATGGSGINSGRGGAIHAGSTLTFTDGDYTFTDNSATGSGSGSGRGGAIYADTLNFTGGNYTFTDNSATSQGGAVYAAQNATFIAEGGDILFQGNTANGNANAIYMENLGNDKTLTLAAKDGHSVLLYDPVESNSTNTNLTIAINPDTDHIGTVLFDTHQSNVYGNTTVTKGTVALTNGAIYGANTNNGSFTLNSGATLAADVSGNTIQAGPISLQTGSILAFDMTGATGATTNLKLEGTSLTGKVGSGDVIVKNFTVPTAAALYTLVDTGAADRATNSGNLYVNGSTSAHIPQRSTDDTAFMYGLAVDTDSKLLQIKSVAANTNINDLTWTGAVNGTWNATTANWQGTVDGVGVKTFLNGDSVVFDSTTTKTVTVDSAGVKVGAMEVTADGYTFNLTAGTTPAISATGDIDLKGSTLNITDYVPNESSPFNAAKKVQTLIQSGGTLTGFNPKVTVSNQANADFLSASAYQDGNDVKVETRLSWYSTDPYRKAHGDFTIADGQTFTLGADLGDNSASNNKRDGWDGKSLTKKGAGTLTLSGTNTYTGSTTVSGGTLKILSDLRNSNVTVAGAKLETANAVTVKSLAAETGSDVDPTGTLTVGGGASFSGATLKIDTTTSDLIAAGSATFTGTNTVDLETALAGSYTFLTTTGAIDGFNASNMQTKYRGGDLNNRQAASYTKTDGALTLTIDTQTLTVTWQGGDGNWHDPNWQGPHDSIYIDGDDVIFGNGSGTVDIGGGTVAPASVTLQTGADYTFQNGKIKTGAVTIKSGAAVDLNVTNTKIVADSVQFDGDVTLSGNTSTNVVYENVLTTTQQMDETRLSELFDDVRALRKQQAVFDMSGLLYTMDFVYETLTLSEFSGRVGLGFNETEVGTALDRIFAAGDFAELGQWLYGLKENREVSSVLDSFRGSELHADAQSMALWNPWYTPYKHLYADQCRDRQGTVLLGPCGPRASNRDAWVEGYFRDTDIRNDGNASKYDGRRGGVMAGIDSQVNQCWKVGAVFGYGNPRVSNRFGKIEADDYTFGLYSRARIIGKLHANTFFGYGRQSYESQRTDIAGPHRAKYDGDSMYASFELFRPVNRRHNLTLFPLLALDYQRSWTDGFTESGNFGQKVAKADMDRLVMRIGLNSKIRWGNSLSLTSWIQYGYLIGGDTHGVANTRFAAASPTSPVMSLRGVNLGRNQFNVGLGGEWRVTHHTRVFGDYDFDLGDRSTAHTGQVGLVTNW